MKIEFENSLPIFSNNNIAQWLIHNSMNLNNFGWSVNLITTYAQAHKHIHNICISVGVRRCAFYAYSFDIKLLNGCSFVVVKNHTIHCCAVWCSHILNQYSPVFTGIHRQTRHILIDGIDPPNSRFSFKFRVIFFQRH